MCIVLYVYTYVIVCLLIETDVILCLETAWVYFFMLD